MNRPEQTSVNVYQNYFDEIMQELQKLAEKNKENNSFSLESLLVKA